MSAVRVRATCAALLALLVAALATASPARADIAYVPSEDTYATVTHLNLNGRSGTIGATLTVGAHDRVIGIVVDIPATGGTWQPVATVKLRAGITCTGGGGTDPVTDPLYSCLTPPKPGDEEYHKNLPVGRYVISLPIRRPTGAVRAMTGTVGVTRASPYNDPSFGSTVDDTFPVLAPGIDPQSSVELPRMAFGTTYTGNLYAGDATMHVIVKPGEQVTGLDLVLPTSPAIAQYTARDLPTPYGAVHCAELTPVPASSYVITCRYPLGRFWPAGAYSLSVRIACIVTGTPPATPATVDLRFGDGSRRTLDTAYVVADPYYRAPTH